MWGFHDRLLTLRKALYTFLTSSDAVDAIYRRWRWQACQQNQQSGLSLTEDEWQEEWNSVLRLASTEPRTAPVLPKRRSRLSTISLDCMDYSHLLYESLEEVHVLVLAHVLRRPIIIVADTILKVIFIARSGRLSHLSAEAMHVFAFKPLPSRLRCNGKGKTTSTVTSIPCLVQDVYGDALAPIPFGGIYLPLEVSPSECHKCPLLLTYDSGHFSALVGMQSADNVRSPLPSKLQIVKTLHDGSAHIYII